MADWSTPTLSSLYTDFLSYMKDRDVDIAKQFDGTTSTNVPTNAIKWDSTANRWKKWDGSVWQELTTSYQLNSLTLPNGTANGVAYLNGSKVLTTGSALTFDGSTFLFSKASNTEFRASTTGGASATMYSDTSGAWYGTTNAYPTIFSYNNAEQMRLTSTGLGIGTSSPGSYNQYGNGLVVSKSSVSGSAGISIVGDASGYSSLYFSKTTGNVTAGLIEYGHASNYMSFATAGSTRLTLDSSGNLGLGVTPSAWDSGYFKVFENYNASFSGQVNASAAYMNLNTYFNGGWKYKTSNYASQYEQFNGQHLWFTAPSGTAGNTISWTQAMTLDASGNLSFRQPSSTTTTVNFQNSSGTTIQQLKYDDSEGSLSIGGGYASAYPLKFMGGTSERMRIDSSGNLLVGKTTAASNGQGHWIANDGVWRSSKDGTGSNNHAVFVNNASGTPAAVGTIVSSGSSTAYNTSSDYRLKENIQPMQNALSVVQQLNPVTYTWKTDGSDGQGFIAHELQAVVPDCVTGEKDAVDADGNPIYQGIDTSFLVATLTAAIQEQQAIIESLTARVAKLEK